MSYSSSSELSGKIVINEFLNQYKKRNGFSLSETDLMNKVTTGDKTLFLKILGNAYEKDVTTEEMIAAMETLANDTAPGIPDSSSFFSALRGQIGGFKIYVNAVTDSAKEVAGGVQFLGEQTLFTGKILTYLLPVIVLGALYYVGKSYLDKARA